jgi:hypothetical protein
MTERIHSAAMRCLLAMAAVAALGCGGAEFDHALPSSPLLAAAPVSRFDPRPIEKRAGGRDDGTGDEGGAGGMKATDGDVRARMIAEAKRLLSDAAQRPERGYGAIDLDEILARVSPGITWDAGSGLERLVALAREQGAFRADAKPSPGDIALFHNELDVDADGALDDWFTGCAVVTATDGPRFTAVARTGHAPREIVAWPDGPAAAVRDGEKANSYLRIPRRSDPADAEYLAGRLFAGYVDIEALDAATRAR